MKLAGVFASKLTVVSLLLVAAAIANDTNLESSESLAIGYINQISHADSVAVLFYDKKCLNYDSTRRIISCVGSFKKNEHDNRERIIACDTIRTRCDSVKMYSGIYVEHHATIKDKKKLRLFENIVSSQILPPRDFGIGCKIVEGSILIFTGEAVVKSEYESINSDLYFRDTGSDLFGSIQMQPLFWRTIRKHFKLPKEKEPSSCN